jgi:hypothetical protein
MIRAIVLAVLVLFLVIAKSNGQENRFAFGIKAGPNYASLSENPGKSYLRKGTFKWAFHGGVFIKIPLSKYFSLQPELNYSAQGQKTEYVRWGYEQKTEVTLQYITVPLMVNVRGLNIQGTQNIDIQVGAQYGYLLSGTEPFDYPVNKQAFATHDFSICGGFLINLIDNVSFGARYVYGLTDVNYLDPINVGLGSTTTAFFPPIKKEQNRVFQVFISYSF